MAPSGAREAVLGLGGGRHATSASSRRVVTAVTTGASRSTFELDLVRAGILGKFGFWAIWESAGERRAFVPLLTLIPLTCSSGSSSYYNSFCTSRLHA